MGGRGLRRDHEKYLTLIDTLALLHQHQREIKSAEQDGERVEYVEVTLSDIEVANELAHEALGRSLDELSPQTRRLLELVVAMVETQCTAQAITRADYRFSRREVREHAGWSDFQVKMHMHKLEELEYVLVHRGGRGQSFVYELLYDGAGRDGKPFLMGLVDVQTLRHTYDGKKEHRKPQLEHPSSPQVASMEHGGSEPRSSPNAVNKGTSRETPKKNGKNHILGRERFNPIVLDPFSRRCRGVLTPCRARVSESNITRPHGRSRAVVARARLPIPWRICR